MSAVRWFVPLPGGYGSDMADQSSRREQPEDHGVPDYADDTTTAFDEADHPRFEEPAAMPADEPQAVDEYGTTSEETRAGEPLAGKLSREEPPVTPDQPWPEAGDELADEVVTEQTEAWAGPDAESLGISAEPEPGELAGEDLAEQDARRGMHEIGEDEL